MSKDHEWGNERFWIEVENKGLYPPEKIIKVKGALELIDGEDFLDKRVLDNGCGTGWLGKVFQDKGADVIGTDISDTLLEEASKRILTRKASSYQLPFNDQTFDYIASFMVIHVLDYPVKAIEESYRVLKPEGKLYVGIVHPNAERWDENTGLCYNHPASFNKTEERTWIFNLTDGKVFTKHYFHRPLSYYESTFGKQFTIIRKLEPRLSYDLTKDGKYATKEYLFLELVKK